ncbi:hypothetical protein [Sorangium sp. So ce385]|uniref:hypothetical protein n=1 Tax=Sorangium sp. So ce385 TaxID=3133308 RepID=UPI003F5CB72D
MDWQKAAPGTISTRVGATLRWAAARLAGGIARPLRHANEHAVTPIRAQVAAAVGVAGAHLSLHMAAAERLTAPPLAGHGRVLADAAATLAAAHRAILARLQAAAALRAGAAVAQVGAALGVQSCNCSLSMQIALSRARLQIALFALRAAVASAGLGVEVLEPILNLKSRSGVIPLLSLSCEQNVPTWYTSCLLFACALTLAIQALPKRDV